MSTHDKTKLIVSEHSSEHGSLKTYVQGFVLSVALTLAAYLLITRHSLSKNTLIAGIMVLALVQFLVQALFFLHLGSETKPRWKITVFAFMIGVVGIIVIGSLWIMANLDYHHEHMTPGQTDQEIVKDEGLKQ